VGQIARCFNCEVRQSIMQHRQVQEVNIGWISVWNVGWAHEAAINVRFCCNGIARLCPERFLLEYHAQCFALKSPAIMSFLAGLER
jgi:hypothetical protein